MAESRTREAWDHTANLLAMMAEINRDRKKRRRPFRPDEFGPFARGRKHRKRVSVDELVDDMMSFAERKK